VIEKNLNWLSNHYQIVATTKCSKKEVNQFENQLNALKEQAKKALDIRSQRLKDEKRIFKLLMNGIITIDLSDALKLKYVRNESTYALIEIEYNTVLNQFKEKCQKEAEKYINKTSNPFSKKMLSSF
jgi:anaerobic ribonucleoside-triphosphate reductase